MILLCRLLAQEVPRFLFLQAFPEGLEGHHHQAHQRGQGFPKLKIIYTVSRLVLIYIYLSIFNPVL